MHDRFEEVRGDLCRAQQVLRLRRWHTCADFLLLSPLSLSLQVRIVADPTGEVTKAMGLDFSAPVLGGVRCKRFSAVVEDGVIKHLHVEQSPGATECSLADPILKLL